MGEVGAVAQVLAHEGILKALQEQVRFTRARFGHYDLIDFAVVLIGYALSGEATLKAYYERLLPFAEVFMALFGRHRLPSRSALSRFLAALDQVTVEALRTLCASRSRGAQAFRLPRWLVGSFGPALGRCRCGWNQTSGPSTSTPPTGVPARGTSSF